MCVFVLCDVCRPTAYTIDTVDLTILPSGAVQSGTPVTVRCRVRVSHDNIPHLQHDFQLRLDDVPVHSSTTEDDSIAYQLPRARAADSGSYECRVTVRDKSKASFGRKLHVAGEAARWHCGFLITGGSFVFTQMPLFMSDRTLRRQRMQFYCWNSAAYQRIWGRKININPLDKTSVCFVLFSVDE